MAVYIAATDVFKVAIYYPIAVKLVSTPVILLLAAV
jgi:hypothetical protein